MKLKSLLFNVQDLYIFMDKYLGEDINQINQAKWQLLSTSFFPNKDLAKLVEIQKLIKKNNPDIIMLIEVGGIESLNNFNQHFLDNNYKPYMLPTNSNRGIDFGFLVKNSKSYDVKLNAMTKDKLSNGKRFARGLFELKVFNERHNLCAIYYLTHLKSKLDKEKIDFEGRNQRAAEVDYIVKHLKKMEIQFPGIPQILCGDLNGIIYKNQTEPELASFAKNDYFDALELIDKDISQRTTYFYFDRQLNRNEMQLDYQILKKCYKNIINEQNTHVLAFDPQFSPFPPETLKEKLKMPSDHLAYLLEIEL